MIHIAQSLIRLQALVDQLPGVSELNIAIICTWGLGTVQISAWCTEDIHSLANINGIPSCKRPDSLAVYVHS